MLSMESNVNSTSELPFHSKPAQQPGGLEAVDNNNNSGEDVKQGHAGSQTNCGRFPNKSESNNTAKETWNLENNAMKQDTTNDVLPMQKHAHFPNDHAEVPASNNHAQEGNVNSNHVRQRASDQSRWSLIRNYVGIIIFMGLLVAMLPIIWFQFPQSVPEETEFDLGMYSLVAIFGACRIAFVIQSYWNKLEWVPYESTKAIPRDTIPSTPGTEKSPRLSPGSSTAEAAAEHVISDDVEAQRVVTDEPHSSSSGIDPSEEDPYHPDPVSLALAGGGIRAASIANGAITRMIHGLVGGGDHHQHSSSRSSMMKQRAFKILEMSCVSGGGYAGTAYCVWQRSFLKFKQENPSNTTITEDVWFKKHLEYLCQHTGFIVNWDSNLIWILRDVVYALLFLFIAPLFLGFIALLPMVFMLVDVMVFVFPELFWYMRNLQPTAADNDDCLQLIGWTSSSNTTSSSSLYVFEPYTNGFRTLFFLSLSVCATGSLSYLINMYWWNWGKELKERYRGGEIKHLPVASVWVTMFAAIGWYSAAEMWTCTGFQDVYVVFLWTLLFISMLVSLLSREAYGGIQFICTLSVFCAIGMAQTMGPPASLFTSETIRVEHSKKKPSPELFVWMVNNWGSILLLSSFLLMFLPSVYSARNIVVQNCYRSMLSYSYLGGYEHQDRVNFVLGVRQSSLAMVRSRLQRFVHDLVKFDWSSALFPADDTTYDDLADYQEIPKLINQVSSHAHFQRNKPVFEERLDEQSISRAILSDGCVDRFPMTIEQRCAANDVQDPFEISMIATHNSRLPSHLHVSQKEQDRRKMILRTSHPDDALAKRLQRNTPLRVCTGMSISGGALSSYMGDGGPQSPPSAMLSIIGGFCGRWMLLTNHTLHQLFFIDLCFFVLGLFLLLHAMECSASLPIVAGTTTAGGTTTINPKEHPLYGSCDGNFKYVTILSVVLESLVILLTVVATNLVHKLGWARLAYFQSILWSAIPMHLLRSDTAQAVFLSDGGHVENLALLPLLYRQRGTILCVDSSDQRDPTEALRSNDPRNSSTTREWRLYRATQAGEELFRALKMAKENGWCYEYYADPRDLEAFFGTEVMRKFSWEELELLQCSDGLREVLNDDDSQVAIRERCLHIRIRYPRNGSKMFERGDAMADLFYIRPRPHDLVHIRPSNSVVFTPNHDEDHPPLVSPILSSRFQQLGATVSTSRFQQQQPPDPLVPSPRPTMVAMQDRLDAVYQPPAQQQQPQGDEENGDSEGDHSNNSPPNDGNHLEGSKRRRLPQLYYAVPQRIFKHLFYDSKFYVRLVEILGCTSIPDRKSKEEQRLESLLSPEQQAKRKEQEGLFPTRPGTNLVRAFINFLLCGAIGLAFGIILGAALDFLVAVSPTLNAGHRITQQLVFLIIFGYLFAFAGVIASGRMTIEILLGVVGVTIAFGFLLSSESIAGIIFFGTFGVVTFSLGCLKGIVVCCRGVPSSSHPNEVDFTLQLQVAQAELQQNPGAAGPTNLGGPSAEESSKVHAVPTTLAWDWTTPPPPPPAPPSIVVGSRRSSPIHRSGGMMNDSGSSGAHQVVTNTSGDTDDDITNTPPQMMFLLPPQLPLLALRTVSCNTTGSYATALSHDTDTDPKTQWEQRATARTYLDTQQGSPPADAESWKSPSLFSSHRGCLITTRVETSAPSVPDQLIGATVTQQSSSDMITGSESQNGLLGGKIQPVSPSNQCWTGFIDWVDSVSGVYLALGSVCSLIFLSVSLVLYFCPHVSLFVANGVAFAMSAMALVMVMMYSGDLYGQFPNHNTVIMQPFATSIVYQALFQQGWAGMDECINKIKLVRLRRRLLLVQGGGTIQNSSPPRQRIIGPKGQLVTAAVVASATRDPRPLHH